MKVGFLFSGQGAQYLGMMKDIAVCSQEARNVFQTADSSLGRSISDLCFNGPEEKLNLTHNTQPCVLAADLAAYAALSSYGIHPDAVAGFSLGEYGALVAAGVISLEEVFPLIQKRADYMQEAVPVGKGAMAAVMKLNESEVISLCNEIDGYVTPVNYNCPGQIVVSGEFTAVNELVQVAKQRKIRAMMLPVSAPFHCRMMEPAAEKLEKPLSQITFSEAEVPVYMNVDGSPTSEPEVIYGKILAQTKSPVRWEDTLRNMYQDGIRIFVELGPGKTLTGFVKKTLMYSDIKALNITDQETLNEAVLTLKG